VHLKAHLVDGEAQVVTTTRANSVAYDRYLLARQRMYERHRLSLESAATLLDEAIAIDPEYAPAYAQRGIVANLLGEDQYGTIPMAQSRTQSKLFIDQALRLDPELAEGWAALGLHYQSIPGEHAKSIETLEKALSLAPGSIDTANWLSIAYVETSQPAKSQALLEDIALRDPLYRPGFGNLAFRYLSTGQLEKVKALADKFREQFPQDRDMLWLDGEIMQWEGNIAASLPLSETAVGLQPQDSAYRAQMSRNLLYTHQYERVAAEGYWFLKVSALRQLGRVEEATLLAQEWAAQGEIASYFRLLTTTGRSAQLLDYLEERWPDPGAFQADYPANSYFGYTEMSDIAWAYREAGNQEKFADAMSRLRSANDSLAAQDVSNKFFFTTEATYYAMADDRARALKFLAAAVDGGQIFAARITDDLPFFADFEGDPEYEAIQARMIEHLNRERAALGLEPVKT
jgi:tetratricopeptide (TPR) repeat protein